MFLMALTDYYSYFNDSEILIILLQSLYIHKPYFITELIPISSLPIEDINYIKPSLSQLYKIAKEKVLIIIMLGKARSSCCTNEHHPLCVSRVTIYLTIFLNVAKT